MNLCPICKSALNSIQTAHGGKNAYNCKRCGLFNLTETVEAVLPGTIGANEHVASLLSHTIRKMQRKEYWPTLGSDILEKITTATSLPNAAEQANNLIRLLGERISSPEQIIAVPFGELQSEIGAATSKGVQYICNHLMEQKLITWRVPEREQVHLSLTFLGWQAYEKIRWSESESNTAFMAMQFNDNELNAVVEKIFKPAVAKTGFELRLLSDTPKAGLIDDRLRVEIRKAKFLIADLTHRNPGAYWEAGFAEGLGKPVIYTCNKERFNAQEVHFDTNHHLTIMWDPANLVQAGDDLKATIRATLPVDAKLND